MCISFICFKLFKFVRERRIQNEMLYEMKDIEQEETKNETIAKIIKKKENFFFFFSLL